MRGLFHVLYSAVSGSLKEGSLPLWNPYIFNGYPLFADPQASTFYPVSWLNLIVPVNVAISWALMFHMWLACFGMYALVRFLGGRWLPSILAGIVFGFGGVVAGRLWAGHTIVYAVYSWTPLILLGLAWSAREGSIWSAAVAGVPLSMAILAGHLPTFIYILMIWLAFLIYLTIQEEGRRLRVIRQGIIAATVGLGIAAVQIVPFIQLSTQSLRVASADYEFASRFSFPPAHLITLIVPEFFGEPLRAGYWSVETFEELSYYAGILALIALILALRRPNRLAWFSILLMVFGILLAFGSYGFLHNILYQLLPPIRLMRAPARAGFLFYFGAALLLGLVLTSWRNASSEDRRTDLGPTLRWILIIMAGCAVLAIAATGAVFVSVHPTDTSGRLWHQIGGYSLALIVSTITVGLLWIYLIKRPEKRSIRLAVSVALIAIVIVDLWMFAYKFVRTEPVGPDRLWLDASGIVEDTQSSLLPWGLSVFTQNGAMQVELRSVFGYNPMAPKDHIALASSVPDPRSTAYDVLGVEYVISETPLDQFTVGDSGITYLGNSSSVWVYQRPASLPVVRLVHQIEVIPESEQAINRIHDPEFNPVTTAILDEQPPCEPSGEGIFSSDAQIVESRPGSWRIATSSDGEGILVVSENAYPGWSVQIDGQKAIPLRAYTSLKAVCVPAGEHLIDWDFTPRIIYGGAALTIVALLFVIVATLFLVRYRDRHEREVLLNPEESSVLPRQTPTI